VAAGFRGLRSLHVAGEQLTARRRRRRLLVRVGLGAVSVGIVVATFVYFLPTIAGYGEVWEAVRQLSWPWLLALVGVAALNVAAFAPPWQVALPGLGFVRAVELTQATTALSVVVPGGAAVGAATAYGITRRWGFGSQDVVRAVTLTSLWNQLLNLSFPIVAVFLLTITGAQTAALATVAFVGVAVLGVVVTGLVLVLLSKRLAEDLGDVASRFVSWALHKVRRGPVGWAGGNFERFRADVAGFLARRWPTLTLASLAASLMVFAVFVVSLRALEVPASQVSLVEAFAAWALVRILTSIPITPGGIGVVELAFTGALVGFGGNSVGVVAAVLVYRFLTVVPTLVVGLVASFTWRRGRVPELPEAAGSST